MVLKVRARRATGFWRAKRFWGREWVTATGLSAEHEAAVRAEPNLECKDVDEQAAAALPTVADAQPRPVGRYEPEKFTDPVLREKQDALIEANRAAGIALKREQVARADVSDETLPREPIAKAEHQGHRKQR